MSLKRYTQQGVAALMGLFVVGGLVAGYEINQIRFGGPLQEHAQTYSDYGADVLPPPAYLIEAMLEVGDLHINARTYGRNSRAELQRLQREYEERIAFWRQADIPANMKSELTGEGYEHGQQFWTEVNTRFLPAVASGDEARVEATYERARYYFEEHKEHILRAVQIGNAERESVAANADSTLTTALIVLGVFSALLLGGLIYASRLIMRQILKPLTETSETMARMAGGDYNVSVEGKDRDDEVGEMMRAVDVFRAAGIEKVQADADQKLVVSAVAEGLKALAAGDVSHRINVAFAPHYEQLRTDFNAAAAELSDILTQVAEASQSVHTGSAEISSASDDLARRTEQQAASLEETAAAMNQVTQMVHESAGSARDAAQSVAEARKDSDEGGSVVRQAMEAMDGIERSAKEIEQITNVIDGIAFQTNLLALNAGVEAARAGDAGKGFAVVANEVRALAQRSADAAKDIKQLITESSGQVMMGVDLVGRTGTSLQNIVGRITDISGRINEIAQSAESQASNLVQINAAVADMDKMTQQNAAMVEESTAAARSLAGEADQLSSLVGRFKVSGASRSGAASVPAVKRAVAPPPVVGNLALKVDDDDWSSF